MDSNSSPPPATATTSNAPSPLSKEVAGSRLRPPPSRRRDKQQLSCNLCRRRKLRCDRQRPCQTCSARGLSLSCIYPDSDLAISGFNRPQPNLKGRLGQLEQLVVSLMHNATPQPPSSFNDSLIANSGLANLQNTTPSPNHVERPEEHETIVGSPQMSDAGSIKLGPSEVCYVNSAHWTAILDGIADLKEHFEVDSETAVDAVSSPTVPFKHVQLLYGCRPASRTEILDALPQKPTVDRHISHYFNMLDIAPSAIHSVKFLREYETFWQSPSDAPVIWIGLLFSMVCLSVLGSEPTVPGEEQPTLLVDQYREKVVQCLALSEYSKGGPLVFETLFHYLHIELLIHKDANKDLWLLLGLIINMVLRMGYHRDPSHFPRISPFDGEMRRRAWATCIQGDVVLSGQMGMPRMIKDHYFDTKEPRNLNDADFDEDTTELPPSRPETEMTTVLQIIARRRINVALGAVTDLVASIRPQPYAEVLRVDRLLNDALDTIPPVLRMKSMTASVTDPPQIIMHRLFLSVMFHKGQLMLHRKYLSLGSGFDEDFSYSRQTCVDASLALLRLQQTYVEETRVGGPLYLVRKRLSSITTHEFLTGVMILCVLMSQGLRTPGNEYALAREEEIKTALENSYAVWTNLSKSSKEARLAAKSVRAVLAKSGSFDLSPPAPEWLLDSSNETSPMDLENFPEMDSYAIQSTFFGTGMEGQNLPLAMNFMGGGFAFDDSLMGGPGMSSSWPSA